ncbi:MAG: hypothetical protein ACP5QA_16665 [Phycisphaerae bacterium]
MNLNNHIHPPPPRQMSTWRDDLADGHRAERRIAAWYTARGYTVAQSVGYVPSHDLTISAKIEVKWQRAAVHTGRVAVETARDGEPSGLATTGAPWQVHIVADTAYAIRTSTLRALVAGLPLVPMGDRRATLGHLLDVDMLARHAHRIDLSDLPEGLQ